MIILAIDPSGSFKEGKGTTGWVLLSKGNLLKFGDIKAIDYHNRGDYWRAITDLIARYTVDVVVLEQYRLYSNKAESQINSEMETSKLLGYLEMILQDYNKKYELQMASQVKRRFNNKILVYKGYIEKSGKNRYSVRGTHISGHAIDALRHALYYNTKERIKRNAKKTRSKTK